jgi:hypothetical protein
MSTNGIQDVRLERTDDANYFVHNRGTGKLIGRVWQEPNDDWWATFYLAEGNVSGGKFGTQDAAVAAVWTRSKTAA